MVFRTRTGKCKMKTPKRYWGCSFRLAEGVAAPRFRAKSQAERLYAWLEAHNPTDAHVYFAQTNRTEYVNRLIALGVVEIVKSDGTVARPAEPAVEAATVGPAVAVSAPTGTAKLIAELASIGQNVLLAGPAGCGKTFAAAEAAKALGRDFAFIGCSAGMSESQLLGWLLPTGEAGRFEYQPSAFVNAYENGGVFLFDELDAADENVLLVLNAALANGKLSIPQRYGNPVALRHPDFACIATANTLGNGASALYTGRSALDASTLDRFRMGVVEMTYDLAFERSVVSAEVFDGCYQIRRAAEANDLPYVISTRVMLDMQRRIDQAGHSMEDCLKSLFADWPEDHLALIKK